MLTLNDLTPLTPLNQAALLMQKLYYAGWPLWAIAEEVNSRNLKTLGGQEWTESSVYYATKKGASYGANPSMGRCGRRRSLEMVIPKVTRKRVELTPEDNIRYMAYGMAANGMAPAQIARHLNKMGMRDVMGDPLTASLIKSSYLSPV